VDRSRESKPLPDDDCERLGHTFVSAILKLLARQLALKCTGQADDSRGVRQATLAQGTMSHCQCCGLLMGEAATFCPTCGAVVGSRDDIQPVGPTARRAHGLRRWALAGAVLALLAVAGVATYAAVLPRRAALQPIAPPLHRLSQSGHLRAGMTPAQVGAALGTAGSAYVASGLASTAPQFYVYVQNSDGQSLRLFFQNGVFSQGVEGGQP